MPLMLAAFAAVGATSFWMEAGRSGGAVPLWPLAVDEATSVVTVLALTPLVFAWTARLHPGRIGWPRTLAGHLAGMLAFSVLAHRRHDGCCASSSFPCSPGPTASASTRS